MPKFAPGRLYAPYRHSVHPVADGLATVNNRPKCVSRRIALGDDDCRLQQHNGLAKMLSAILPHGARGLASSRLPTSRQVEHSTELAIA